MFANLPRVPCVSVLTHMHRCAPSLRRRRFGGGLVAGELVVSEFVRRRDLEQKADERKVSDTGGQGMRAADSAWTSESREPGGTYTRAATTGFEVAARRYGS